MQDSIRCEDAEMRVERLAFLRALGERELLIPVYEVELEEDGCTSQLGKHGIHMRHRPHMILGLSVDRAEVDGETKSFPAILRKNEWGTGPFRRRVPVDVAHVREFIALLLHEIQLLRRVGALSHLDWAYGNRT